MAISVPRDVVFASLTKLKIAYGILTILGILIAVAASLKFADSISTRIEAIRSHAEDFAGGDLSQDDIIVDTQDETGDLAASFNTMGGKLRHLISEIAKTSEQVAASSEELTANAHQSAEASMHVAETIGGVSGNMDQQVKNVEAAMKEVDTVYTNIATVTDKANRIGETSQKTVDAAQQGSELMQDALVGLRGEPREIQTLRTRLTRADAVLPAEAGDEIASGISHDGHAELSHRLHHIGAEAQFIR